jgi:DTW domain-containing protein
VIPFEPRVNCARCTRPPLLCYCEHLVSLETRTRVLILQHPIERDRSIGTARMASLCLTGSEFRTGVDFESTMLLREALADRVRPAALLFPGPQAIDLDLAPPRDPITLIVVDGTWRCAKKIVKTNPSLAALPRYAFRPRAPSEYRIRREPKGEYVSTIEALAHALGVLEGDRERFDALRVPFRAMIDAQIAYERRVRGIETRRQVLDKVAESLAANG